MAAAVKSATLEADASAKITELIGSVDKLPTPPTVYQQITRVLDDPDASAFDIASILAEDAAMTAKILRLSNSAYYGLRKDISSVKQAVVIIGIEGVKSLVLAASIIDAFGNGNKRDSEYTDIFWRHSLAVAFMAKIIARSIKPHDFPFHELSFSAGILHDIGKLIFSSYLYERHVDVLKFAGDNSVAEIVAENQIIGSNHSEAGFHLAEKWRLPATLKNCIALHHHPSLVPDDGDILPVIHLANYLVHHSDSLNAQGYCEQTTALNEDVWNFLDIPRDKQESFLEELSAQFGKAETFLKLVS